MNADLIPSSNPQDEPSSPAETGAARESRTAAKVKRLTLAILTGAVTTIAIAVLCFNSTGSPVQNYRTWTWATRSGDVGLLAEHMRGRGHMSYFATIQAQPDARKLLGDQTVEPSPPSLTLRPVLPTHQSAGVTLVVCAGWPMPCLWGRQDHYAPSGAGSQRVHYFKFRSFFIPTGILWPGLLTDAAFFSAIGFGLLLAPDLIRRAHRRRRGLCTACGYNLAATPSASPCPECGQLTRG